MSATPRPWHKDFGLPRLSDRTHAIAAVNACHELGVEPDELVERVRQTVEALQGLLTVDWDLERGDFYDPETYAGKVWGRVRAALALWKPEPVLTQAGSVSEIKTGGGDRRPKDQCDDE